MAYEEFSHLKKFEDKDNPYAPLFELEDGSMFYIEPTFYTQLSNFKEMYSLEDHERIIKKMEEITKERKKVIFTYDYEHPYVHKDGFILLEFTDVTDLLQIMIEDKSRGSDYGD